MVLTGCGGTSFWTAKRSTPPKRQSWVVNHGMKETLTTAYGYLLHDFTPPDLRKGIVLYDRTSAEREGVVSKSILADGVNAVRLYFRIDAKRLNGEVCS